MIILNNNTYTFLNLGLPIQDYFQTIEAIYFTTLYKISSYNIYVFGYNNIIIVTWIVCYTLCCMETKQLKSLSQQSSLNVLTVNNSNNSSFLINMLF